MPLLPRLSSLCRTLFRRQRLERELDDELQAAVETLADRHQARGLDRAAARRAAVAELGGGAGLDLLKADVRDARIGASLEGLVFDLRHAWRGLWRAPGLTLLIVGTLALGIGANTAIFSMVQAILIEALPYRDADRLLFVWADRTATGYPRAPLSGPELADLREGSRTCSEFEAIWASGTVALTGEGEPEQLRSAFVTPRFFQVLGAEAALGRTFRLEDTARGAQPTILLGWDLFQRRFGGDPAIVGRRILVNEQLTTVIGVMPARFRLLLPADASVPDRLQAFHPFWSDLERNPRQNRLLRVIARMRPGVTAEQAADDISAIARRKSEELSAHVAFTTVPLQADGVRDIRGPLLALFAGVVLLLMVACVNVAGLLIARAASRSRETALRLALGAGRGRLLRGSLCEGLLLTTLGAAAGVLAGHAGLRLLVALTPESLSRLDAARIDARVLGFTLATSALWGILFSLAPLAELLRADAGRTLQPHWRTHTTPVRYRTRGVLVIVQVAASVVLLSGAGLLVRAFLEVQRIDPGFATDGRLTFRLVLPERRYPDADHAVTFDRSLQQRLAAMTGVTAVGALSHLPYDDLPNWGLAYRLPGVVGEPGVQATPAQADTGNADTRSITPGLFETLGVRLVDGRFFTEHDGDPRAPVVIVDDHLARRLWGHRSAIGQQLVIGQGIPSRVVSVVGVVRHLRLRSLVEDLTPQIYLPYRLWQRSPMAYVVRTSGDPAALAPQVRAAVAALDPRLPIFDVRPMAAYVDAARAPRRFTTLLGAAFAASAFALACIGVYGVIAYSVAHRRRELGVRRALGADAARVIRGILREGMGFALAGSLVGLAGAFVAARLLQQQLYAVDARDPLSYAAALGLILAGAVLACWVPARRATAVSPLEALRGE